MSRATEAFDRLSLAMTTTKPECLGDDRFTADGTKAAELVDICEACPLFALCRDYAQLDNPKAGIWAGIKYPTTSKKKDN